MPAITLARHAMATRFELVINGADPVALRAAGEEALAEVERLEAQLSLYRSESEIARLNARAALEPVRVTPEVLALLQQAQRLHAESGGAFDITIGPLVRCWGFMGATGKLPAEEEIAEARARVGMEHVRLDARNLSVRFTREGVMLDLGAIGKGYAVGRAAEILRDAGVGSALVHGGTSTVYAIGHPPEAESWAVAVEMPDTLCGGNPPSVVLNAGDHVLRPSSDTNRRLATAATVLLREEAMSVSAIWGRSFETGGKTFGHVIDPRTGQPVDGALLAAVVLPSATETDAFSTALLTAGRAGHDRIASLRRGMRTLLLTRAGEDLRLEAKGIALSAAT